MLQNYTCKYHKIGRYDDDMYIKRYVGMLRIYVSEVSIRSVDNIYISIKYRKHVVLYMFLLLPKAQILSNDFFLYKLLLDVS